MDSINAFNTIANLTLDTLATTWKTKDYTYSSIFLNFILPFVITLVVIVYMWRKQSSVLDSASKHHTTSVCKSKACVRCHKYTEYTKYSMKKLDEFARENGWNGLGRLLQGIKGAGHLKPINLQNPNVLYVPGLFAQPWWSSQTEVFMQLEQKLQQNYIIILEEFQLAYSRLADIHLWKTNDTPNGQWNVFYFYNQGKRVSTNCSMCPAVSLILDSTHSFMKNSVFGNASFSVLQHGTSIEEHHGPTNTRIRCHFGLQIPERCTLIINREHYPWRNKEATYFDDSFLHSAVNNGDTHRAILLLDVWHPNLTQKERHALNSVFGLSEHTQ